MIVVEVTVPDAHETDMEWMIDQCCQQPTLLGKRQYPEIQECLLVVQWTQETDISNRLLILRRAKPQKIIRYCSITYRAVVRLCSPNLITSMVGFPLLPGDAWIPAASESDTVYAMLHHFLLSRTQTAWLMQHEVQWSYLSPDA